MTLIVPERKVFRDKPQSIVGLKDSTIAFAYLLNNDIVSGKFPTSSTASFTADGSKKYTDNTVNEYYSGTPIITNTGNGSGDFSFLVVAKISAYDGTVSSLFGNKNDVAGSPFRQGLLQAHTNSVGGASSNLITLYTFDATIGAERSVTSSVSVNTNKYQTIIGVRRGLTYIISVDGVITQTTLASNTSIYSANATNLIIGNSGKATNADAGDFLLKTAVAWNRALEYSEIQQYSQNPYQIFAPRRQLLYVSATSVQLSYLRPASDITTGSWSPSIGTTLYGVLDEVTADDADYIQASTATGCEIKLSAGSTPSSRDNHTIKYRLLAGSGNIAVVLKCGSTTIKSWNHVLTGSAQDFSQALSNAEATNITDYSDLRVTFTSS